MIMYGEWVRIWKEGTMACFNDIHLERPRQTGKKMRIAGNPTEVQTWNLLNTI
jgi:hypothetical protein